MPYDLAGALGAGFKPQEITDYLAANPDPHWFDVAGALKAGYTPEEVIDYLNPNRARSSAQGTPILAPVQRGIAHLSEGAANLAEDLGATGLSADIRSRIPQVDLQAKQATQSLSEDLSKGNYGTALTDLPSAALEAVPQAAAGLAAAPLTGGSSLGAVAAGAGLGAVTGGDAIARQRAANNGHAEPTATDLTLGILGGAAQGAAGGVGLGGVGERVLGPIVAHTAADAMQPEMSALAGSVGTGKGMQNASPADIAASALVGSAMRGGLAGPDLFRATMDLSPGAHEAASAKAYAALSPDDQQSIQNLAAAKGVLDAEMENATPGPEETTRKAAARTAVDRLVGQVGDLKTALDGQGLLGDDAANVIDRAVSNAKGSQRVLGKEDLDGIEKLGLDDPTTDTLKNTVQQIALLSDPDIGTAGRTPLLEAAGNILGRAGSLAVGAALGHGLLGYAAGHVVGPAVQGLGAKVATALGMDTPPLIKRAGDAIDMLNAAGVAVPDTRAQLNAAIGTQRDALAAQARILGMKSDQDAADTARWRLDYADALHMNRQFDASQRSDQTAAGQLADTMAKDQTAADQNGAKMATTRQSQLDTMERQQQADMAAAERKKADIEKAYKAVQQTPDYDAAFKDMEARQAATPTANDAKVAQNTRSQVAAYLAETAAKARPPQAPQQPTQGRPGTPQDVNGPIRVAQQRVSARAALGEPQGLAATPPSGLIDTGLLPPDALAQARRLPEWKYALGAALEDALVKSGQARPVAMGKEVDDALSAMQGRGWLAGEMVTRLKRHDGRVVPLIYNAVRNEMLLRNGIDRTYRPEPVVGLKQAAE